MLRLNFVLVPFSFLFFFLSSCILMGALDYSQDVTTNSKLWNGYRYGQTFSLNYDMFLRIDKKYSLPLSSVSIVPPSVLTKGNYMLFYSGPPSIKEYKMLYNNWPHIKGILRKGTLIKCSKIVKWIPHNVRPSLYIFAKILNGEFAGMEVEIRDLSLHKRFENDNLFLHSPNLKLITPVDE